MTLRRLTQPDLIALDQTFSSQAEAISYMAQKLDDAGKLNDKEEFIRAVMQRESEGPTALGEHLAVPHGKTDAVKEATFAIARLSSDIEWEGIDGPEPVNLIAMLAIPTRDQGSTHIKLLTDLTTALVDDDLRAAMMATGSEEEFIRLLCGEQKPVKKEEGSVSNKKTVVCVTACATGVAHTYMAAEHLLKAGKKLGIDVYVEKQGANGTEDAIPAAALAKADAVIIAADVAITGEERFAGIPTLKTKVAEPIRKAGALLNKALSLPPVTDKARQDVAQEEEKQSTGSEIRQALMTGVSYMLPLVIAGAVIMGAARIGASFFGVIDIWDAAHAVSDNSLVSLFHSFDKIGGIGLGLMLPVIAGFIGFSLAGKPALGPGMIAGALSQQLETGFLGAVVAGLLAGYIVRAIVNNIKLPGSLASIVPIFVVPFLGTLTTCLLMFYVIGDPLAAMNRGLESWLLSMSGSNKVLLAAIIGGMVGFDLGGPVNKAAVTTAMGLLASGIYDPNTAAQVAIIVPPIGLGLAAVLWKQPFGTNLHEAGKASILMGLVGVSEGAIPFVMAYPRLILLNVIGSATAAAMAVGLGAVNKAPISGFYGWLAVDSWGVYVLSIAVGSAIIGFGSILLIKPKSTEDQSVAVASVA